MLLKSTKVRLGVISLMTNDPEKIIENIVNARAYITMSMNGEGELTIFHEEMTAHFACGMLKAFMEMVRVELGNLKQVSPEIDIAYQAIERFEERVSEPIAFLTSKALIGIAGLNPDRRN